MQKVAKEVLGMIQKGQFKLQPVKRPAELGFDSFETFSYLFATREMRRFLELGEALSTGVQNKKSIFEVWMLEQSDQVRQSLLPFPSLILC